MLLLYFNMSLNANLMSCGICDCCTFPGAHSFPQSAECNRNERRQCSGVVHQTRLSDNRWDVECLPGLSTRKECVRACMLCGVHCVRWWTPAGEVLTAPYETCWRMITMENDYHSASPAPSPISPPPSLAPSFASPIQHVRSSVTLSPCCQGCQSTHTASPGQLLPGKQSDFGC